MEEEEDKKRGKISSKIKNKKEKYKAKLIPFKEILMAITVALAVIAFFLVRSCSNSLSGVGEVTIINKFMEGTAYVVVDQDNIYHYVDEESYNMVLLQTKYKIEQYQYTEHLRPAKDNSINFLKNN